MTKGLNNTLSPYSATPLTAILGHYADVIEGGRKWSQPDWLDRDGATTNPYSVTYDAATTPVGVAGYGSPHRYCESSALVVAGASIGGVVVWNGPADLASEPDLTASPFYLHHVSGAGATLGEVRRITAQDYDGASGFEHTAAFSADPADTAYLQLLEGFRRAPPGIDINDDDSGVPFSFDRMFTIDVDGPGSETSTRGAGFVNRVTEMTLRIRYQRSRNHRVSTAMMFHNANILTRALELGSNRDPFYTRSVRHTGSELDSDPGFHLVAMTFDLEYRATPVFRESTSRLFSEIDA